MSGLRALLTGLFVATAGLPTQAAPEDYCAAYARDFADAGKRDEAVRKRRLEDATKACLAQFSTGETPQVEKPKAPIVEEVAVEEPVEQAPAAIEKKKKPTIKPVKKIEEKAVSKAVAEEIEAPKPIKKTRKPKVKKLAAKKDNTDSADEATPEPAVIVAPDIAAPPADEKPKKNTLLSIFKRITAPEKKLVRPVETPVAVPASGGLRPGSPAWLDYCARKYASFNRATGTYVSRQGVERKCKVTRS